MPPVVAVAAHNTVPPSARWFHQLAWLFVALAVALSFWGTVGKPDCMDLDFGSYYRAARAVASGNTPYTLDEHGPLGTYPYAPVFPFLFMPLGCLDYPWACRVWLLANWLVLAACCGLGLRLANANEPRPMRWQVLCIALVPTAAYLWATLRVGQASLLVLLGCLAWATCWRCGWRFSGGLCLATACALKLAPGILVPYMMLRRDFRGLAGWTCATLVLFAAPALWVGGEGTVRLHAEWMDHTLRTHVPIQTYRPGNQSLLAQLARLPAISNGHQCYSEAGLQHLCAAYPLLVGLVVTAGLAVLAGRREAVGQREVVEVALLLTLMTLVHPRGWRCNFVAMLLPCLLLAREAIRRGPGFPWALAALFAMTLACALPTNGLGEDGWSFPIWLLQGKHFWGALIVGATCWRCYRHPGVWAPQQL
jgi:hypothetical protein